MKAFDALAVVTCYAPKVGERATKKMISRFKLFIALSIL
jgi:hypothetical protein